ncbi:pyridoxal-phosphate dependent enzyme [Chryseolinea lacunae]|uniref:Pyridoxal-phosphate dependent enzyme n=1 Tax=Chryseolinea lacunae TaxID=2801331 RepID=A0ABS1KSC9_9BACT|nr:pyridoxal-phosphate dependent enzyme [Chryseolinea lacunae]MBL0741592.1 pyridoxal-phosphate dependent enzyme [Chryseolinea lacunae]
MPIPDRTTIEAAHERIKPYIHHTPVMTSAGVDEAAGCHIFFKCENFQKIGAFKARGAMNAVLSLSDAERAKGVGTHSSGNHAQALARAAKIMGTKSYIVMPRTAPEVKKRGVRGFDGEIFECEPTLAARESTLAEVVKKTGAAEIHPFNNYEVIAGQATAAKELFEEVNDIDVIIAPVGGGGLLSGTALATKYFSPKTTVIAAEPEGADDAFRSMQSGKIEPSQSNSIADGLLTSLGDKTFPIIRENVKEVITVSDAEIVSAMRLVWERMKIVVEPSCVVPLAAVLKSKAKFAGKRVGIILSGGNVDLERALKLMTE